MKNCKRIIAFILAVVLCTSLAPTHAAMAATKKIKAKTVYVQTNAYVLEVEGVTSVKELKSSKRRVIAPQSSHIWQNTYQDTWYDDNGYNKTDDPGTDKFARIYLAAKKPGTSTISFRSGEDKYYHKITVKKYVNPLKKLTISNVNDGEDIHDSFQNSSSMSMSQSRADTVKLSAQSIGGWVIKGIQLTNKIIDDNGNNESVCGGTYRVPKRSASVMLCDYDATNYGYADITLLNKRNKGEITISVTLTPAK